MALTRFNGNVVPFASESTTDNRTVFGDVVQADDIDSNLNADFKKGWEIVGLNDNPTKQDFNAMGYTLGALISYLYQMGIAEYNSSQEYKLNAVCIGTDGTIYQSLVDANIGNALNNVSKWKNINNSFVDLVNNQSINGIKTFVKSPIVPTPTTGTQAANKEYVDSSISSTPTITGSATFAGTTQNINLTNIGNITLAIGDVIEVTGTTSNNKLFTVESIVDNNNIVVNYEHRGTSTPAPSKRLANETASNCTVKLYNRAKNAPLGQGQGWVATPMTANEVRQNLTGRTISWICGQDAGYTPSFISFDNINWIQVAYSGGGLRYSTTIEVPDKWYFKISSDPASFQFVKQLR